MWLKLRFDLFLFDNGVNAVAIFFVHWPDTLNNAAMIIWAGIGIVSIAFEINYDKTP